MYNKIVERWRKTLIKTYKVRLEPNNVQNTRMLKSAGTARWVYNWVLAKQKENYELGNKFIQDGILRKELTQLKKSEEFSWLFEVSNDVAKQAVKDACNSYKRFFKKQANFPKFKSRKKSKPSFYNDTFKLKVDRDYVTLAKIGKVKISEKSRVPYGEVVYYNPRITFDGLNWYLSVGVESNEFQSDADLTDKSLGIDLGIKDLAILSNGKVYPNINRTQKVKKLKKKLRRMQRQVSRKYQMNKDGDKFVKTKNVTKLETKIKKQYIKLTNIRTNYRQQITTEIVKTKPSRIVVEDLNVKGMMKNKHLSKAIGEQSFYAFIETLRYKCEELGIEFVKANRWFPSSKTCSSCGNVKKDLKLTERIYECDCCGKSIDRDLNASINLARYTFI